MTAATNLTGKECRRKFIFAPEVYVLRELSYQNAPIRRQLPSMCSHFPTDVVGPTVGAMIGTSVAVGEETGGTSSAGTASGSL